MSPTFTFLFGLLILGLFVWYFMTDAAGRKRFIGLVLTVLLVAFCIEAIMPPEKKIRLGLDLQGGTSFLLRLVGEDGEDAARERDVAKLHGNPGVFRKSLNDREERVSGEKWSLVGFGVENGGWLGHGTKRAVI